MTIYKFRIIDLLILTSIGVLIDLVLGFSGLFGLFTYISISMPLLCAMYIRWGKYAMFSNMTIALSQTIMFLVIGESLLVVLSHLIAVLSMMLIIPLRQTLGMNKETLSLLRIWMFYLMIYSVMFFTGWVMSLIFGVSISLANHGLNHTINIFLGLGLLAIMSRQKDLLTDMHQYLLTQAERK